MRKDLVYSALILSGIIATGGISLNFGPVPLTFQVFFVIFAGLFLPPKYSYVPMAIYLFLGAIGLPVFAGFTGGFEHFISPTGGYLMAFPISSLLVSLFHRNNNSTWYLFTISMIGLMIIYILGITVLTFYTGSFLLSLKLGFLPFILVDIVKVFISIIVYKRVNIVLYKTRTIDFKATE